MNYYFTGVLIILMTLLALFGKPAFSRNTNRTLADPTQVLKVVIQVEQQHINLDHHLTQQLIQHLILI